MNAIEEMTAEHRVIEIVIKSLPDAVTALDHGRLNVQKLRGLAEFLRDYADRRHHQREEGIFFPILVKRGVPGQGCPIGGLNNEHEKARALVTALEECIMRYTWQEAGAGAALRRTLQEIAQLYKKHLWMEDAMVFPMAEKLLTEADNRELKERFAELDRAIGPEAIMRHEQFAGSLSFDTKAGVAPGDQKF